MTRLPGSPAYRELGNELQFAKLYGDTGSSICNPERRIGSQLLSRTKPLSHIESSVRISAKALLCAVTLSFTTSCAAPIAGSSVEALATTLAGQRAALAPLPPEQLRRLQVRDYGVERGTAFAATINALLDLGYRIETADLTSGLIVAKSVSNERLRLDLAGLLNERETSVISAFVEPRGESASRVRVSMVIESVGRTNTGAAVRAVQVAEPYEAVFAQLSREIADRQFEERHNRPAEAAIGVSSKKEETDPAAN